jgi:hypothetical protein
VAVARLDAYSAACIVAILITLRVYSGVSGHLSIVRTEFTLQSEEQHTLHARSRLLGVMTGGPNCCPVKKAAGGAERGMACAERQLLQMGFPEARSSRRRTGCGRGQCH